MSAATAKQGSSILPAWCQRGAYCTDGTGLYEVHSIRSEMLTDRYGAPVSSEVKGVVLDDVRAALGELQEGRFVKPRAFVEGFKQVVPRG